MGFLFDQKFAIGHIKKQTFQQSKNPKHVFVLKPGYTFTWKGPFDLELYFFSGNLSSARGIYIYVTIHRILNFRMCLMEK